jgi:glycosyltransferase involved in cell wall biosynthesis
MTKVYWLCSWYPNGDDPYTGDFVQRHAQAVSAYQAIDVIYVHKNNKGNDGVQVSNPKDKLQEWIYQNPVKRNRLFSKWAGLIRYYIIHQHHITKYGKPDLVHVQIPIKAGVIAMLWKWRYGIPYVVTEHYGIYNDQQEDHFKTRNFLYRWLTRWVIKNADALTTVSDSLGKEMNHWVMQKPYTVIPNVVDTALFHYAPQTHKNRFRFLHVSNMIPLKNVDGILQAAALLKANNIDFTLHLIGNGDNHYPELAQQMNLADRVTFLGVLPYPSVAKHMSDADALIIFSDTESQSCVVLESLCSGRPAIVTRVGGVQELINESNGLKVDARDVEGLANAMQTMIKNYHQYSLPYIAQEAHSKYTYDAVAKQFTELYQWVLTPKRKR